MKLHRKDFQRFLQEGNLIAKLIQKTISILLYIKGRSYAVNSCFQVRTLHAIVGRSSDGVGSGFAEARKTFARASPDFRLVNITIVMLSCLVC